MSDENGVWPSADKSLETDILNLVQSGQNGHQLKKGANECTKALNRGVAELIVLAADTAPLAILLHLPLLCEDKNVPYIYVSSKKKLGLSCGVSRDVVAACVTSNQAGELNDTIQEIRARVERAAM